MSTSLDPWQPYITDHPSGLMTAAEVASVFRVSVRTVRRWESVGQLTAVRTPSGRCRYRIDEVRALVAKQQGKTELGVDGDSG